MRTLRFGLAIVILVQGLVLLTIAVAPASGGWNLALLIAGVWWVIIGAWLLIVATWNRGGANSTSNMGEKEAIRNSDEQPGGGSCNDPGRSLISANRQPVHMKARDVVRETAPMDVRMACLVISIGSLVIIIVLGVRSG